MATWMFYLKPNELKRTKQVKKVIWQQHTENLPYLT